MGKVGGWGRAEQSRVKREREQDKTTMSVSIARLIKSKAACPYDRRPAMRAVPSTRSAQPASQPASPCGTHLV